MASVRSGDGVSDNPYKLKTIMIDPQKVVPCMWRNLVLNPLSEEQIIGLMRSQQEHGIWGALRGRPISGGCVEQAFGHHLLEAARRLGIPQIKMEIGALTDDVMMILMVDDNADQSGGKPGKVLEIVYAATTRLAKVMLFEGEFWQIRQNLPQIAKAFANEDGFLAARGRFENGAGCGRPLIMAYLGKGDPEQSPYREWEIKEAIATLKLMGELPRIAEKVIAANERTLAAIEKLAEQAKTEAKKAREIGDKAKAKAAEDRERRLAARVSAIRETPRLNAEKNPQLYDGECNKLFSTDLQLTAYRTSVTAFDVREVLPVEAQFPFGRQMMDALAEFAGDRDKVTGKAITDYVRQNFREAKSGGKSEAAKKINNVRENLKHEIGTLVEFAKKIAKATLAVERTVNENPECKGMEEITKAADVLRAVGHLLIKFVDDHLEIKEDPETKFHRDFRDRTGIFADDITEAEYKDITPETDDKRLIGCG